MRKTVVLWCSVLVLLLAGQAHAEWSAELRIKLPGDVAPRVSVLPGSHHVLLNLPAGAEFPLDFEASTNGLVRAGEVVALDGGRVRVELTLAHGLLHRIDYEPDAVVLHFASQSDLPEQNGIEPDEYVLGPSDRVVVTVHNHPEASGRFTITRDGSITAPLIGSVEASGQSPQQLAIRISDMLSRNYLVDPQVNVEVEQFRSQWVMVAGEVRAPGRSPLKGGTRLKSVLAEAGGFTDKAGTKILISREIEGAEDVFIEIDRLAFENGEENPELGHGDIITVSRVSFCYVEGEVRSPGPVRLDRQMTLLKAISTAGGLSDWADQKEIRVISDDGRRPSVYNLKKIKKGQLPDPVIHGDDVILVGRRFF